MPESAPEVDHLGVNQYRLTLWTAATYGFVVLSILCFDAGAELAYFAVVLDYFLTVGGHAAQPLFNPGGNAGRFVAAAIVGLTALGCLAIVQFDIDTKARLAATGRVYHEGLAAIVAQSLSTYRWFFADAITETNGWVLGGVAIGALISRIEHFRNTTLKQMRFYAWINRNYVMIRGGEEYEVLGSGSMLASPFLGLVLTTFWYGVILFVASFFGTPSGSFTSQAAAVSIAMTLMMIRMFGELTLAIFVKSRFPKGKSQVDVVLDPHRNQEGVEDIRPRNPGSG